MKGKMVMAVTIIGLTTIMVAIIVMLIMMLFFLPKLKKKTMLQYYSDDSNYETVSCIVTSCQRSDGVWYFYADIATPDHHLQKFGGEYRFAVRSALPAGVQLNVGDTLVIISAGRIFYDGWAMPVVGLKRGDETLLEFAQGKTDLLDWLRSI